MDLTGADQRDLNESMHAFKAAVSAQKTALHEPPVERILVAIDGSNQDEDTVGLAMSVARSFGASLHLVYAREGQTQPSDTDLIDARVRELTDAGLKAEAIRTDHQRRSFDQIITAADQVAAHLIVVDAPYLDDFESLGDASIGTNLQMLMSKSRVPLLVVRQPMEGAIDRCLAHVLLGITLHKIENRDAAAWALKLLGGTGEQLRVLAVIDHAMLETLSLDASVDRDLTDADPEFLSGLRRPDVAGLIAAVQRTAAERGIGCRVSVRTGEVVPVMSDLSNDEPRIVVAACPRDPSHGAYQRVEGLIRASRNPVLVV